MREAQFRSHYNAAIVAIHRNGERLTTKIGDVKLESGDTLLMQTGANFVQNRVPFDEYSFLHNYGQAKTRPNTDW